MRHRVKTVLSAVLLAASLCAGAANAADRKVNASDLDLRDPGDAVILYERIKLAAAIVCRSDSASWDSQVVRHFNHCRKVVIEKAVASFDQPLLTAVHEQTINKLARN